MSSFSIEQIANLLAPYAAPLSTEALTQIERYLALLLHWNQRTNLTAVRDPEALVQRQIGESLFAGQLLRSDASVLDFGSGAGFPGIPMKILLPGLQMTLAESQGKKASFLREAARSLHLDLSIWGQRVELLPPDRIFDVVTMRAVDHTPQMLAVAEARVSPNGRLLRFVAAEETPEHPRWQKTDSLPIPLSHGKVILWKRADA